MTPRSSGRAMPLSSTRPCSAAVSASRRISAVPRPRPCQAFSTSTDIRAAPGPSGSRLATPTALPPSAVTASTADRSRRPCRPTPPTRRARAAGGDRKRDRRAPGEQRPAVRLSQGRPRGRRAHDEGMAKGTRGRAHRDRLGGVGSPTAAAGRCSSPWFDRKARVACRCTCCRPRSTRVAGCSRRGGFPGAARATTAPGHPLQALDRIVAEHPDQVQGAVETSLAAATSISTHSPLESRNVTRDRSSTR